MQHTTNLNLAMPEGSDYVDAQDLSENFQKIDDGYGVLNSKINAYDLTDGTEYTVTWGTGVSSTNRIIRGHKVADNIYIFFIAVTIGDAILGNTQIIIGNISISGKTIMEGFTSSASAIDNSDNNKCRFADVNTKRDGDIVLINPSANAYAAGAIRVNSTLLFFTE